MPVVKTLDLNDTLETVFDCLNDTKETVFEETWSDCSSEIEDEHLIRDNPIGIFQLSSENLLEDDHVSTDEQRYSPISLSPKKRSRKSISGSLSSLLSDEVTFTNNTLHKDVRHGENISSTADEGASEMQEEDDQLFLYLSP
ncbi:hypothetical protein HOLleu_10157 [Holothuria leucospilota]|uniref:Uncharacterized protein n=1 Tax=Holothuria leucospilota TaxID=206669 RepID=A0A9Q1CED3_HOLLE|nr:hypothetical protein HOLleu_10157 [Holothuria leucospilota]